MNTAYKNMRAFWLDIKNLANRKGILEIGPDKISVAGVEMAFSDGNTLKHIFIGTNSLGDSSLYFENNSPSGIGGIIGGHGNAKLQEAAARMLAHASKLTSQMEFLPAGSELPPLTAETSVCLFAVSKEKLFFIRVDEQEVRLPENPFYPMFAYSQQVLGFFKEEQNSASAKEARA